MIADVLESDHSDLHRLLAETRSHVAAGRLIEAFSGLDLFWARLAVHIRAEHLHLFPAILNAAQNERTGGSFEAEEMVAMIDRLRSDHNYFMRTLAGGIKQLRARDELAGDLKSIDGLDTSLEALEERLGEHNRVEEDRIYCLHEQLCTPAESSLLNRSIVHELENLPPRFAA